MSILSSLADNWESFPHIREFAYPSLWNNISSITQRLLDIGAFEQVENHTCEFGDCRNVLKQTKLTRNLNKSKEIIERMPPSVLPYLFELISRHGEGRFYRYLVQRPHLLLFASKLEK